LGRQRGRGAAGQGGSKRTPAGNKPHEKYARLVDLSHTIEHGMTTYPGLPGPLICDYLSREASRGRYAPGVEFQIGKIEMVANTGTYLDSPFHRFAQGKDLSRLPLESLADLDGLVVRVPAGTGRAISRPVFEDLDLDRKAVLVHTGWDVHWRTEQYLSGNPFLTQDAAEYLVSRGVMLVGIDSLNIDDTADTSRPVHSTLLGADIPIVEHLCNLSGLSDQQFRFFAVPAKVAGFGSWPVRAFGHVLPSD
jgi:arylformamidase